MGNSKRLIELDVMRGLAALSVVLYHYINRYDELFGHNKDGYFLDLKYGYLGVELFFMISGFVIFMTLEKCNNIKDFLFKRVVRLYPAYIFAVILTFSVMSIYSLEGRDTDLADALVNLTMLQGLITPFGIVAHVDGVYWSLTVEVIFYAIMGCLFVSGNLKNNKPLVIWLLVAFAFRGISVYFNNYLFNGIQYYGIMQYCHLFIAGIMFYKLRSFNKIKYHIIISACLAYQLIFNSFKENLVVSALFLLFYIMVYNKLNFVNYKFLSFLGTISFSLYLVHQNIGYVVINILEKYGFVSEIYILIPVTVSIVLATLITFYIEKPIHKLLLKNKKATGASNKAA
ncbi:acyltransferase [Diaphorobacter sp. DS2]|nr:acyltransferase [Diaphorobacter sp. DS2]